MMAARDLYDYPRRLRSSFESIEKDKGICLENKQDVLSFCRIRLAKGATQARVAKVAYCLRRWAVWLGKPLRHATKDNLIALVGELEPRGFAEHTKYDFKIVLKMFYKWLKGDDENFPSEISWLKPRLKNEKHKLPEELLNEDEILKLAETARHPRDKALILALYESGCRIGELLTLKLKNVQFDKYGAILRVTGKTGDRRVRIISSAGVLSSWMDSHPWPDVADAMLWPPLSRLRMENRG